MEIALLNDITLRIKGKHGSLIINPSGKFIEADGFIALKNFELDSSKLAEDSLVITGPGEYEFGGIKVSGIRFADDMIYSLKIERIDILLGHAEVLEREHAKLNEHNLVVLYNPISIDPSFVTSLASNASLFYGEKAAENIKLMAKEGYRSDSKYSVTYEKLLPEAEKILLIN